MFKTPAICLLLILVFSIAHAPTFDGWGGPIQREHTNEGSAAAQREYAEKHQLKRLTVDEHNLPRLDVSLPALFEWLDGERTFLVLDASYGGELPGAFTLANAASMATPFGPYRGAHWGYAHRLGTVHGGILGIPASWGASIPGISSGQSAHRTSGEDSLPSDLPPTTPLPPSMLEPVPADPVAVPAPGSLLLFAVGLAGLRWAGRNKKHTRCAAS